MEEVAGKNGYITSHIHLWLEIIFYYIQFSCLTFNKHKSEEIHNKVKATFLSEKKSAISIIGICSTL